MALYDKGRVRILPIEIDGSGVVRSVIYFHPQTGVKIGTAAIEAYQQDVAKAESLKMEEKFTGK